MDYAAKIGQPVDHVPCPTTTLAMTLATAAFLRALGPNSLFSAGLKATRGTSLSLSVANDPNQQWRHPRKSTIAYNPPSPLYTKTFGIKYHPKPQL